MQPNTTAYLISYLLLMAPTYVLPYFGSNSSIINAASAAIGWGVTPLWWMHALALTLISLLAWARGGVMQRLWLPALSVLAASFDLLPLLSMIPFIPTLLHLAAILCGVMGEPVIDEESVAAQRRLNGKLAICACVASACATAGILLFDSSTLPARFGKAAEQTVVPLPGEAKPVASQPSPPQPTQVETSASTPVATSAPVAPQEPVVVPTPSPMATSHREPVHRAPVIASRNGDKPAKPVPSGTTTRYIKLND